LNAVPDGVAQESLEAALARRTDAGDTHPALHERLTHLVGEAGREVAPSGSFPNVAARAYFGSNHQALERELSEAWGSQVGDHWQQQYAAIAEARDGVATLSARPPESLSSRERFQLASWTEDLQGADVALPMYEAIMAADPDLVPARYAVGRIRLHRGDESGLALIDQAMDRDADAILPGCELAIAFLESQGRSEAADRYRERGNVRHQLLVAAHEERDNIGVKDSYLPSDLAPELRAPLLDQLVRFPEVRRAFLVRKAVKHFAETPMHVLLVQLGWSAWSYKSGKAQGEAVQRVAQGIEPPDGVHVFVVTDRHRELVNAIKRVRGSLLYDRKHRTTGRRTPSASQQAVPA
jgi:hypothetical protein